MLCRVCLRKNMKVYYELNDGFKDLIGRLAEVKMAVNDLVCCFCLATLRKIQKFTYSVREADSILKLSIKTEENEDNVTSNKLYNFTVSIRDNYSLGTFKSACDTHTVKVDEQPCEVTNILKRKIIKEEPLQSSDSDNMDDETDQEYYNVPLTTAVDITGNKILNQSAEKHGESPRTQMEACSSKRECNKAALERFCVRGSGQDIGTKRNEAQPNNDCYKQDDGTICVTYRALSCGMCAYKARWKSELAKHLTKHTGEKPFSCNHCSYKCSYKGRLTQHLKTHTGEKPFSCDICHFRSSRKNGLILHSRTHTGEKPFFCNECTYKCGSRSHLISHLKIHSGEKRWSCDWCSYKCDRKKDLKLHLKKHDHE